VIRLEVVANMALRLRGGVWSSRYKVDGLLVEKSTGTPDKRKAELVHRQNLADRAQRKLAVRMGLPVAEQIVDPKLTLEAFLKKFEAHYVNAGGPDLRESRLSSWRNDVSQLKSVIAFLGTKGVTRPSKVTARHAEAYKDWRLSTQCSVETVKKAIRCARAAWSWAIRSGYVRGANPFSKMAFPRSTQTDPRNLTPDEIRKALDTARLEPAVFPMLATAMYAGLRRAELAALEWTDVRFGEATAGHIRVRCTETFRTKSRKPRTVPLAPELAAILKPLAKPEGLCFPSPATGERWLGSAVTHAFQRVSAAAEVEFTPHDLRRTFASILAARGVPPTRIRDYLGHASVATTESYYLERGAFDPADAAKLTFEEPAKKRDKGGVQGEGTPSRAPRKPRPSPSGSARKVGA